MAEAVVGLVVELLVSAAADKLKEEIALFKVKPKIDNMEKRMKHIQTILGDGENQTVKKETIKLWLANLRDVSYDMEDLLDGWSTRVQIQEREKALMTFCPLLETLNCSSSSPMTCSPPSKKLNCFSSCNQFPWRRKISLLIHDINDRIESVFSEMDGFKLTTEVMGNDGQTTTSSINESKVFGRDVVKEILLTKILSVNTEHEKRLQVISIVGGVGIGKTTLAQMIFNDEKVKKKFGEKRIWVCVSNPFDEIKVAQAILEGLNVAHNNTNNPETLYTLIKKSLSNIKFLLVLDDVWEKDPEKWESLSIRLKVGDPVSRVLVTTRQEEVGRTMGTLQSNILKPQLISDSECWSLMEQRVLKVRTIIHNDEMEIGKEIAKKCKGLPLAAKAFGELLVKRDYVEGWREVLNSQIWQLEDIERYLFSHISLSYHKFSSVLKRCFLILALFPIDTYLEVENVIHLWMAQGYLNPRTEHGDMVTMGQQHLNSLVSHAFLELKNEQKSGKIMVWMHDIMHHFALSHIGEELLSIMFENDTEIGSTSESNSKIGRKTKARHLIIKGNMNQTSIGFDLGKLRTCILHNVPPDVTLDLVKQLEMVRLLDLEDCELKQIPKSIMNLIHLRKLVLSYNPLVELPEAIGDLFNLQHLFLEGLRLSSLPQSLGKLVNLMSLIPSDLALEKAPESVEKLINLQSLDRVKIVAGKGHLGLLKDLNQLQGVLKIEFKSDYDDEADAKNAAIGRKIHLTGLALYFKRYNVTDGVVAALKPHPRIQSLKIIGLLPSWITFLHHLEDLHIENEQISTLPPLWELASLEKIVISKCHSLETIGREFLGIDGRLNGSVCAFPKLVELIFSDCYILTEFEDLTPEDEAEIMVMPKLDKLKITRCPKFQEIPSRLHLQLSSLRVLHLPHDD